MSLASELSSSAVAGRQRSFYTTPYHLAGLSGNVLRKPTSCEHGRASKKSGRIAFFVARSATKLFVCTKYVAALAITYCASDRHRKAADACLLEFPPAHRQSAPAPTAASSMLPHHWGRRSASA